MSAPTQSQICDAVEKIREESPVDYLAASAEVNAAIRRQNEAVRAQLEAWGLSWSTTDSYGTTVEGRHVWHTGIATHPGGQTSVFGRWGDNPVEVEIHLRLSWHMFKRDSVQLEVIEDADCSVHDKLTADKRRAEKQAAAIFKKQQKTKAKYRDTTTSDAFLASSAQDGMLF